MKVAIAGAGIGGMTAAALLDQQGHEVVLIEQAASFGEVGAGIQISPNATCVLHHLELADSLTRVGTTPERIVLRRWEDDGQLLARRQGAVPIERYGFPYYNVYRPDLVDILASTLSNVTTRFGVSVAAAHSLEDGAELVLADGTKIRADVVVGADGIHSAVRDSVFEAQESRFSGSAAYRALVPRTAVPDLPVEVTNRLGPDRHLVSYFVGQNQRLLNLVCVVPEEAWTREGWNEPGSVHQLRESFAGWSSTVSDVLACVQEPVFRWALYDRAPMAEWVRGRVVLLGDACHAMLPYMAQGAAQAIEDAAVLARLLSITPRESVGAALEAYQQVRQPRAARFQKLSRRNATTYHLHDGPDQVRRDESFAAFGSAEESDPHAWIYGYNPLTVDLAAR